MNVHACLEVDARHKKVLVTFKIENRGERRVWLPRAVAADTRISGRLFDLRLFPGEAAVACTGPAAGRAAPDPGAGAGAGLAGYVELAPHSAHAHTLDITEAYAFQPGEHIYQIRYEGRVVADSSHPELTTVLRTEPVMFSHAS